MVCLEVLDGLQLEFADEIALNASIMRLIIYHYLLHAFILKY